MLTNYLPMSMMQNFVLHFLQSNIDWFISLTFELHFTPPVIISCFLSTRFVFVGDTRWIYFFILIFLKNQFHAGQFLINRLSKDVYKNVTILVKNDMFAHAIKQG